MAPFGRCQKSSSNSIAEKDSTNSAEVLTNSEHPEGVPVQLLSRYEYFPVQLVHKLLAISSMAEAASATRDEIWTQQPGDAPEHPESRRYMFYVDKKYGIDNIIFLNENFEPLHDKKRTTELTSVPCYIEARTAAQAKGMLPLTPM